MPTRSRKRKTTLVELVASDADDADDAEVQAFRASLRRAFAARNEAAQKWRQHERAAAPADRVLRVADVRRLVPISRSTLYRWTRRGLFPTPVQLGPGS